MDAVPIDKYFELFKPGAGGEGGFIRISMDFVKTLKDRGATTGNNFFFLTCSMYSCLIFFTLGLAVEVADYDSIVQMGQRQSLWASSLPCHLRGTRLKMVSVRRYYGLCMTDRH
jgi:hypothetical protein